MEWILLIAGILLVLGTGFFVAVEFSLIAIDVPTVQRMVDQGDRGAEPLLRCLKSLSTQLSACQLGITLTTLLTGYVMDPAIGRLVDPLLIGAGVPEAIAGTVSLVVAMVTATLLSMLIGELVPKNMAISQPLPIGRRLARPMLVFTAVFRPAIAVLNGFSNRALGRFGIEAKEEISGARSPEELSSLVRRSAQLGTLDQQTATFLDRTLRFADRTAADVMTPRIRVETVGEDEGLSHVVELARQSGFSRFPVIGESSDDIRGVVHVKRVAAVPRERRADLTAGSLMSDIIRVPETVHLDQLLAELREANLQMAVVVDEYGGTAGVVTLEDVVEEIVGEVADEHDRITPGVLQTASGRWYFPADLRPDEAQAQITALSVPEDGAYETIGGFVMARLGRIARVGDVVAVDGGSLAVERMDGRRVERVRFDPVPADRTEARA
ncbi:hemolysin family protein [Micrococcaceae bacterium Sec6.3]